MTISRFDNVMPIERLARVVVGSIMLAAIFYPDVTAFKWLALVAIYPFMTAIMAWDPLYALVGQLKVRMPASRSVLTHSPA